VILDGNDELTSHHVPVKADIIKLVRLSLHMTCFFPDSLESNLTPKNLTETGNDLPRQVNREIRMNHLSFREYYHLRFVGGIFRDLYSSDTIVCCSAFVQLSEKFPSYYWEHK